MCWNEGLRNSRGASMTWWGVPGGVPGSVDAGGNVWEVLAGGRGRAMGWVVPGTEQQGARDCPEECTEDGPPAAGQSPGPLQVPCGVHGPTAPRGQDEAEMQRWEVTRAHVPLGGVRGVECVVPKDQLREGGHRVGGGAGRQGHSSHGEWAVGRPGRKADPPTSTVCRAAGQEGRALSPQRGRGAAGLGGVSLRRSWNMAPSQRAVSPEGRLGR